jgi:hypothetical protein
MPGKVRSGFRSESSENIGVERFREMLYALTDRLQHLGQRFGKQL